MSAPLSASMDQILDRFDEAWNGPAPPRIENFAPLVGEYEVLERAAISTGR